MTAPVTAEYDLSRLTSLLSTMKGFLIGTGATPGQCQNLLRVQAGLLAQQISKSVGPSSETVGRKGIESDMRKVFFPLRQGESKYEGSAVSFANQEKQGNQPDFLWLFAYGGNYGNKEGTDPSFLVGADTKDILGDGGDMRKAFYEQANRTRGAAWQDLGDYSHHAPDSKGLQRPHFKRFNRLQHAIKLNRVIVTPAAYAAFKKKVLETLGQLRASFAATAQTLKVDRVQPPFVSRQIGAVRTNGKSIFNGTAMNHPTNPVIEFGSRAKGVTSNPIVVAAIHSAVGYRAKILAINMMKILKGAKYNFETGATFFQKTDLGENEE